LLQTRTEFTSRFRHSADFFLVAPVEGSQPKRHDRARLSVVLMGALVLWLGAGSVIGNWLGGGSLLEAATSPAMAAVAIAGLMVVGRCLPIGEARAVIDLQVLVTIAAALGLGKALDKSGAAEWLAGLLLGVSANCPREIYPWVLLGALYLLTVVFTEMLSNNAVVAMLFPIAVATAAAAQPTLDPRPFVMAVILGASFGFLTPIGYQTNLMVMGPGGYQPRDYLRAGWPLAILMGVTVLLLVPVWWPFELPPGP
jgi:di/tricarboxylate transporter